MVILARYGEKAAATIDQIKESTANGEIYFIEGDLASLESVRKAADTFRNGYQRLDVLIDNAGLVSGKRNVTVDGFEQTFQVNHLSHFLLTNLLLDILKKSAPSRIIVVGSQAHSGAHLDFNDLMLERDYSPFKAYGRSKLANLLFGFELARRLDGTGVTANCLHPGVVRTNFGHDLAGAMKMLSPIAYPFMISARKRGLHIHLPGVGFRCGTCVGKVLLEEDGQIFLTRINRPRGGQKALGSEREAHRNER